MKKMLKTTLATAVLATLLGHHALAADGNELELLALAGSGNTEAALELVSRRTDVNQAQADGTTALHWAVYYNDADLVKQLIRRGAEVTVANDYGATPMSQAATQANAAIIKMLLNAGADANERGADDQTPLMLVARTSNTDAARVLLKAGAELNATEKWRGQTALMWACAQQQAVMVKLLLENGADADLRSAPNNWQRQVTAEPRMKILPPGQLSALHYAAREGCADCVAALIKAGADLDIVDGDGTTALVMAGLNAHWDSMQLLIAGGANVNKWDIYGRNPLYMVVDYNTLPHGGRTDKLSKDLARPIDVAQALVAAGANVNLQLKLFPPYRALGADRGADGQLRTGATALFRAARGGDAEMVKFLVDNKALVDLPNENGLTPLIIGTGFAASDIDTRGRFRTEKQAVAVARLLLDAGADVNAQVGSGQTALFGAAAKGYTDVVALLAEYGADLQHKDAAGKTALDSAMGRGAVFGRSAGGEVHPETGALLEKLMAEQH